MSDKLQKKGGDLTITALYTSQTWLWGGFDQAELFANKDARAVFNVVNFFLGIARFFRRKLPSLRDSLTQRHAAIDHLLAESKSKHVLELASGLSRRGASVSADETMQYVELDLPHVVAKKHELLQNTEAGRRVAKRVNWRLVAGDVATTDLGELVPDDQPVFVIAEGLFMYLKGPEQRQAWSRMAALVKKNTRSEFVFDLVPPCEQPKPGLIGRMLGWAMKVFTKGRTFEVDERTRSDMERELNSCGFATVDVFDTGEMVQKWNLPGASKRTQMLVWRCRA